MSYINASNSGFGGIVQQGDSSGVLQLQTAGTTAVTIDTSQNVGIGTASPTNIFTGFTTVQINNAGSKGLLFVGPTATGGLLYSDGTLTELTSVGSTPLVLGTNSTERMRIDTSGYVTKPYQVAFLAYNASGTAANPTIFASTTINIGSAYNTSNGRFTAPIAGRYLISTMIHSGNAAGGTADFRLQKNGSIIEGGGACKSPSYYAQATGVVVVQLAAGDYLTVLTYANFSNVQELTSFSGYLLG